MLVAMLLHSTHIFRKADIINCNAACFPLDLMRELSFVVLSVQFVDKAASVPFERS